MCTWGGIQLLPANAKLLLKLKLIQTAEAKGHSAPSCNVPYSLGHQTTGNLQKQQAICKNKPGVINQLVETTKRLWRKPSYAAVGLQLKSA